MIIIHIGFPLYGVFIVFNFVFSFHKFVVSQVVVLSHSRPARSRGGGGEGVGGKGRWKCLLQKWKSRLSIPPLLVGLYHFYSVYLELSGHYLKALCSARLSPFLVLW
jgi:hypothetical protein